MHSDLYLSFGSLLGLFSFTLKRARENDLKTSRGHCPPSQAKSVVTGWARFGAWVGNCPPSLMLKICPASKTPMKGLHHRFTKCQAKRKLDYQKLRYLGFYVRHG